jgi:hypothetical protein
MNTLRELRRVYRSYRVSGSSIARSAGLVLRLALIIALAGCATCERHPVACGIGGALIVGSVAATIAANDHHHSSQTLASHSLCEKGVTACGL